jgi:nucleoid DNA-binding protein
VTLTKNKMVREIGRRTRLKNRDVQAMLEALIDVWTEELVSAGRIELENFMVIDVRTTQRAANRLLRKRAFRQVRVKVSKRLKERLKP